MGIRQRQICTHSLLARSHTQTWQCDFCHTVDLQWLEHWWLVYYVCFELLLASLGKKSHICRFRIIKLFFLYWIGILWVLIRIAKENTQHTLILRKIEKIPLLCLLTWCYDEYSLARINPVSNIVSSSKGDRAIWVPDKINQILGWYHVCSLLQTENFYHACTLSNAFSHAGVRQA